MKGTFPSLWDCLYLVVVVMTKLKLNLFQHSGQSKASACCQQGTKPDGSSYASLSSRGFDSLFVDDAHQSRLKPVVEQESAMAQLVQSQGTGFRSIARNDELVPSTFKRRLTSSKRSQGTSQSRTQQLLIEPVQSDSPKGLDRALTPAMVEALQIRETIDTGPCIVEQGRTVCFFPGHSYACLLFAIGELIHNVSNCFCPWELRTKYL